MTSPGTALEKLVERFDESAFDVPRRGSVIRLGVSGGDQWDLLLEPGSAQLTPATERSPDALLTADVETWGAIARDVREGMQAFRAGRLRIRRSLHLGVGFLAATSGSSDPARLELRRVRTRAGWLSTLQAGTGEPILALHGLGGTKASFLPTLAVLSPRYRVVAVDQPGFGESSKPLGAAYDAAFFARAATALLDALDVSHAHVIGNSMGGRVAIELGLREPDRIGRITLLAPSLAWLRERRWQRLARIARPELSLLQPTPRQVVDRLVRRMVPGATDGWTATAVDEFMRSFGTARGRAAFYAAARQIYLEEPHGPEGFWTRLRSLRPETLFVWGRRDTVVPVAFARHVREALPAARHVELDCGHVPQVERPRETHAAIRAFLEER